jgi:hypothetical protein
MRGLPARIYYICMTTEEKLDRLTDVVTTLAGAVTAHDSVLEAHDRQIGALITVADKLQESIARTERQSQAYLNTLPRR